MGSGQTVISEYGATKDGNFGNFENINLSGYKWLDTNGDTVWDGDEVGVNGWMIVLDRDNVAGNGNEIRVTITSSTIDGEKGAYSFADITPSEIKGASKLYVYEINQSGFIQTYGSYDVAALSGVEVKGAYGKAEIGNFGNWAEGICGLTPGFWGQHFWAWDGNPSTEGKVDAQGKTLASKLVADNVLTSKDVLKPVDSNRDGIAGGTGDVLGILVGDLNKDGLWNDKANVFIVLKEAQNLINSSTNLINGDQRAKIARDAIATQLNLQNGATLDSGVKDLLTGAALWLTAGSPYNSFSGKNSSVTGDVDTLTQSGEPGLGGWADTRYTSKGAFNGFAGTAVTASMPAWQQEKLYMGQNLSASEIHETLDDFNNCYIATGIDSSTGQTLVMALVGDGNDANFQDDRAIGFGRLTNFSEFMATANLV